MSDITVEKLAEIVGNTADQLLLQMKEAGLNHSSISDVVTDKDKKILLDFLKDQQNKSSKTISLKKKKEPEAEKQVKNIEIKRKRVEKSAVEDAQEESEDSRGIDFNEIEKKRLEGEAFKKSEEERKKKEEENKTLVKRKVRKSTEPPIVKR
ncbi:uncharacterized protein METZ01_LOCUS389535, partial [marine metagenome]